MLKFEEEKAQIRQLPRTRKKLHFENERSGRASKLHFTDEEKAADRAYVLPPHKKTVNPENGDFTPEYVDLSKSRSSIGVMDKLITNIATGLSNEITKLADSSENDAVRAADRTRRISGAGAGVGRAAGRVHWDRRNVNEEKRLRKKEGREIIQHEKERLYEMRHEGREAPSAINRRRKLQKRKQIRKLLEQSVGKKPVDIAARIIKAMAKTARKFLVAMVSWFGLPLIGILLIFVVLFGFSMMMFGGMVNTAVTTMSSYTSAEADLEAASVLATKLEAELEKEINDIPLLWKWEYIDEFRYDLDPIGHDPFELMGYLSVTYPGFEMGHASPVPEAITALHDKRYELITEQQTETRYYEETYTDPVTGEEETETVAYDYYILNIILRSKSILEAVKPELAATPEGELWEWYKVLEETAGARQEFENPFAGSDWRGSVTSLYGYRIDPLGGKGLQLHKGLDIAAAGGTPIAAGITGRVRYVGNDAYFGNYIILESEEGVTMKYAHCRSISAQAGSEVEAGEEIATVGSTGASSGNHLHIEIKRDGRYINPIYALKFGGKDDEK